MSPHSSLAAYTEESLRIMLATNPNLPYNLDRLHGVFNLAFPRPVSPLAINSTERVLHAQTTWVVT